MLTTKFATRPAPRKRPWICKRSPPCLPPPPYPPSLLGSFTIQRRQPPPAQTPIAGSFLLYRQPGPNYYLGRWDSGFDYFICHFHYDLATDEGWAEAYWSAGPTSDHGNYFVEPIRPPPILHYFSAHIQADNWDWWTALLITS